MKPLKKFRTSNRLTKKWEEEMVNNDEKCWETVEKQWMAQKNYIT